MNEAAPESRVEIAFSSTVPAEVRDAVLADLDARGIQPTRNYLAYAHVGLDPTVIALTVLITCMVKPNRRSPRK